MHLELEKGIDLLGKRRRSEPGPQIHHTEHPLVLLDICAGGHATEPLHLVSKISQLKSKADNSQPWWLLAPLGYQASHRPDPSP